MPGRRPSAIVTPPGFGRADAAHQHGHRIASLDVRAIRNHVVQGKRLIAAAETSARSSTATPKPPAWRIRENALSARVAWLRSRTQSRRVRSIPSAAADAGSNVSTVDQGDHFPASVAAASR